MNIDDCVHADTPIMKYVDEDFDLCKDNHSITRKFKVYTPNLDNLLGFVDSNDHMCKADY